ncbi:MAG: hypothetical protein ACP5GH_05910 [Nitrososphaeria archaeon]
MVSVEERVRQHFTVFDVFYLEDGYEFEVYSGDIKRSFLKLYGELEPEGYRPYINSVGSKYVLKVRKEEERRDNGIYQLLLIFASIASVLLDGYYKIGAYSSYMLAYEAPLLTIIALHESVRRLVSYVKKIRPMKSYAIPGFPGIIPFMGFITTNTNRPVNRDELFDETFYPLLASLAGVVLFIYLGYRFEILTAAGQFSVLTSLIGIRISGSVFAAGSAVAATTLFVNMLPGSSLDGGLLISSMKKYSFLYDLLSVIIMSFLGYFVLALIVIFMQRAAYGTDVLDRVSPLSTNRKVAYFILLIVAFALFITFGAV